MKQSRGKRLDGIPRRELCLGLAAPAGLSAAGQAAGTQPARRVSEWNVVDYGAAGDGSTDNTRAFQQALDAAAESHGGIVSAPNGRYRFAGSLQVPKNVTLRGTSVAPTSHSVIQEQQRPEYGTVLLPTGGATARGGQDHLTSDPKHPVPASGGRLCCHPGYPAGSFESPATPDRLTCETAPLERDVRIAGAVFVRLSISSDALDGDIVGRLIDVAGDGKPLVASGGALRLRYRESTAHPRPLTPGKVYRVHVDIGPAAITFRAGHRIRLQLTGSDFPNYSVNLNSGESLERGVRPRKAHLTVLDDGSYLELHAYGEEP